VHDSSGIAISRVPLLTRKIVRLSELFNNDCMDDLESIKVKDPALPQSLQTPVILVDLPVTADEDLMHRLSAIGHLYTTSGANPDVPTRELVSGTAQMSNRDILRNYADEVAHPSQFEFTLDVIEGPVDQAVKRLKDRLGIKDSDHVAGVVDDTAINLDGPEEPEEEEVVL
jgi:hypothetical protein